MEQYHLQAEEPLVQELPLEDVWGFAPNKWSKQCGMNILPIFLLRLGSSLLNVDGLFSFPGDLGRDPYL